VVVGENVAFFVDNETGSEALLPIILGHLIPEKAFEKIFERIIRPERQRELPPSLHPFHGADVDDGRTGMLGKFGE